MIFFKESTLFASCPCLGLGCLHKFIEQSNNIYLYSNRFQLKSQDAVALPRTRFSTGNVKPISTVTKWKRCAFVPSYSAMAGPPRLFGQRLRYSWWFWLPPSGTWVGSVAWADVWQEAGTGPQGRDRQLKDGIAVREKVNCNPGISTAVTAGAHHCQLICAQGGTNYVVLYRFVGA